jgi:uncharacterized sulfatase
VILADDLGFNDVSSYGRGIPQQPTPNIDALARAGVRFDRGYAGNAVCSPSRATLLTGRYSSRFGFEYTPTPGNMAKVAPMFADPARARGIVLHPENASNIADFNESGDLRYFLARNFFACASSGRSPSDFAVSRSRSV